MKVLRLLVLTLLIVVATKMSYSWDLYIQPGMSLYGDAVGFDMMLGARIDLQTAMSIFKVDVKNENFIIGSSFAVSGAQNDVNSIWHWGLAVDFGYKFVLPVLDDKLSVFPYFNLGMGAGKIGDTNFGIKNKFELVMIPRVEVNYAIIPTMDLGLVFGFSMYVSDKFYPNMSFGVTYAYHFGGAKTPRRPKASEIDKSGDEDVMSVSFYAMTPYDKNYGGTNSKLTPYDEVLKKAHDIQEFIVKHEKDNAKFMENLAGLLGKDKRFARSSYTEGMKVMKDDLADRGVEMTIDSGKGEYRVFYDAKKIDDDTKELLAIFGQMIKGFSVFAEKAKKAVGDSAALVPECDRYIATAKFDFAANKDVARNVENDLKAGKKNMQSAPKRIEKQLSIITKLNSALADNFTIGKGKGTPVGVPTGRVTKKTKKVDATPAKRDISVYVYTPTKYTRKYSGEGTNIDTKLASYDDTIGKAHDIQGFVLKFEKDTAKFMENLASILAKDKRFVRSSYADGLKSLKDDLAAMGVVLTISETDGEYKVSATGENLSDETKKIVLVFEKVIKSIPAFSDNAKKAIGDSVVTISECDRYLATAKFDFAANKDDVRNVEKDLKTAKKNMQSVPKRLEKIMSKVQNLDDAIKNTFK